MKLFARIAARKKSGSPNKMRKRRGWRWILAFFLIALPVGLAIAVLAFYSVWAQTFDLKRLGTMPERNTVFDVDGKIYSRLAGANRLKVPPMNPVTLRVGTSSKRSMIAIAVE